MIRTSKRDIVVSIINRIHQSFNNMSKLDFSFSTKSRSRILFVICSFILFSSVLTSCEKMTKTTLYQIKYGTEELAFSPNMINDPDLRELFSEIWNDINYGFDKNINTYWYVDVTNDKYSSEDKKAIEKYDFYLPEVEEIAARCEKKLEDFEKQCEESFQLTIIYELSRYVAADGSAEILRIYRKEFKYN